MKSRSRKGLGQSIARHRSRRDRWGIERSAETWTTAEARSAGGPGPLGKEARRPASFDFPGEPESWRRRLDLGRLQGLRSPVGGRVSEASSRREIVLPANRAG